MKPIRQILKTIDGKIIVRPKAPDYIETDNLIITLSDVGKRAWNDGEKLDFYKGHFDCFLNKRTIALAKF